MKMKRIMAVVTALTLLLAGTGAFAMYIQCETGTVGLEATCLRDGEQVRMDVSELQLIGTDENGDYLIYANQDFYTVGAELLEEALSRRGMDMTVPLPSIVDMQPMVRGTRNDAVVPLQQVLNALGYLPGAPDGDFGGATERAVNAFLGSLGLEQNGMLEPVHQLLLLSMAEEPVTLGVDLEAQFAPIADRANVNMDAIIKSGLLFEYDDMTGNGFISNKNATTVELTGESDIERYELTVRFGLRVKENGDGNVSVDPAAQVSCRCVRRPVLTEIIVKSGAFRGTAPVEELTASLDGVYSVESGVVVLSNQMVEALANASEAGELKLRISGRYNSFDIDVAPENLAAAAKIGKVAQEMAG